MHRYYQPYKLSVLQRSVLTPYFGIGALINPERGDFVAGLGDVTGIPSLKRLHKKLISTEQGKKLLQTKPIVSTSTLNMTKLRELERGTMGREYSIYMDSHGFSADERTIVRFMLNKDLAYVMARYRQIHDFWHVLSELPPTLLGEVALKCFEHQVTGLPSCALSGVLGQIKLSASERSSLYDIYIPWAIRAAKQCEEHNLLAYMYEDNLHRAVDEVRKDLNFEVPPPIFN